MVTYYVITDHNVFNNDWHLFDTIIVASSDNELMQVVLEWSCFWRFLLHKPSLLHVMILVRFGNGF